MIKPELYINYSGQDWTGLKMWLEKAKANKVEMLIGESSHDKSNQIRGALTMIKEILALEEAARKAAK